MDKYFYTDELLQKGYEMFNSGMSITKISEELGVDRHHLSSKLKEKYNINVKSTSKPRFKYDYNSDMALAIVNEYQEVGVTALAKKYELSVSTVTRILKYHNVELRKMGGMQIHTRNSNIFNVIDSEEKAYWLGFLYADGSVTQHGGKNHQQSVLELGLKAMDEGHLIKFQSFLDTTAPIGDKEITLNGKKYKAKRILIYDKQIVADLIRLGCVERKSLILKFPTDEIVPKELKKHFIRGYLDGDGSICDGSSIVTSILGTREFLTELMEFLNTELSTTIRPLETKGNISYIRYFKDTPTVLNYLYQNAKVYLDRKHAKYAVLVQLPQKG